MNEEYEQHIRPTETLSTVAPRDAPIADVLNGVEQVQKVREKSVVADSSTDLHESSQTPATETASPAATAAATAAVSSAGNSTTPTQTSNGTAGTNVRRNSERNNRFSIFRTFSKRTKNEDSSNIRPYPGT